MQKTFKIVSQFGEFFTKPPTKHKIFHKYLNFETQMNENQKILQICLTISKNLLEQNIKKIEATESPKFLPNMIRKLIIKMDRRQNVLKNFQI